jgi:hypothetical protein
MKFAEGLIITIVIAVVAFLVINILHGRHNSEIYQAKCEAAGGEMLIYSRPKQHTRVSCVRKESLIDIQ